MTTRDDNFEDQKLQKTKTPLLNKMSVSMLAIISLSLCAYAIIAPFLPFVFKSKGIDQIWIGYIFASFSIGVIISSPLVHRIIPMFGRRRIILSGMTSMSLSFILFGFLSDIQNQNLYIAFAVFSRFVQGFSAGLIQTTCYSVATNFFPDDRDTIIGYMESVQGFGLIIGPGIGTILYNIGGNNFVFHAFGGVFIIATLACTQLLDSSMDTTTQQNVQNDVQLSSLKLLKNPKYSFAAFCTFIAYFIYCMLEPILAFRLVEFNLNVTQIGIFFMLFPITYLIFGLLVTKITKNIQRRALLISLCVLTSFVYLLIGPSQLFMLPDSIWIMGLGQILLGGVSALMVVPVLPEMIEQVKSEYPAEYEQKISDISSGLFNMTNGLAELFSPLFGSYMTQYFGFRYTCDTVVIFCMLYALVYYQVCDGHQAFTLSFGQNESDQEKFIKLEQRDDQEI